MCGHGTPPTVTDFNFPANGSGTRIRNFKPPAGALDAPAAYVDGSVTLACTLIPAPPLLLFGVSV